MDVQFGNNMQGANVVQTPQGSASKRKKTGGEVATDVFIRYVAVPAAGTAAAVGLERLIFKTPITKMGALSTFLMISGISVIFDLISNGANKARVGTTQG